MGPLEVLCNSLPGLRPESATLCFIVASRASVSSTLSFLGPAAKLTSPSLLSDPSVSLQTVSQSPLWACGAQAGSTLGSKYVPVHKFERDGPSPDDRP
jgi:hypothetical protein